MAVRLSPTEAYEKLARNLKNAQTDMQNGVMRVTESPTKKAAANLDKARANYNKAIDSGKMKRRLESVGLADWQKAMVDKGVPRVAQGIDGAKDKTVDFYTQFFPHLEEGQRKISGMPDKDLEQNIARMVAMTRHNAGFKRK